MYACTNKQYITSHRHTNIHKHTRPLDHTLAHKHISLSSLWRQTLPCLLPRRKLSQEGATDQRLSFMLCLSVSISLYIFSFYFPILFFFPCLFQKSLHQHLSPFICPRQQLSKFYCSPNLNQKGA